MSTLSTSMFWPSKTCNGEMTGVIKLWGFEFSINSHI